MATWFSGTRGAEVYTWTRTAPEAKGRTAHGNRRDLGLGCLVIYVQRAELSTLIIVINTWTASDNDQVAKWRCYCNIMCWRRIVHISVAMVQWSRHHVVVQQLRGNSGSIPLGDNIFFAFRLHNHVLELIVATRVLKNGSSRARCLCSIQRAIRGSTW